MKIKKQRCKLSGRLQAIQQMKSPAVDWFKSLRSLAALEQVRSPKLAQVYQIFGSATEYSTKRDNAKR